MSERYWIEEGAISTPDGQEYALSVYADLEDEGAQFKFHIGMLDLTSAEARDFMSVDAEMAVENPLIELGISIAAIKLYAGCVAWQLIRHGIKEMRKCYQASRETHSDMNARERAIDILLCLSGKGSSFKDETVDALMACIPMNLAGS